MKFFKNSIKNFSLAASSKQNIGIPKNINRQYISLKTNYTDDFIELTNLIGNSFNITSTSQIYHDAKNSKYSGYLELNSNLNEIVLKSHLDNLVEEYGIDLESASFELVDQIPNKNSLKDLERLSLFNKQNVSGIVSAKLYDRTSVNHDGGLNNIEKERNHDIGVILDKLEENKQHFNVIELQAEPDMCDIQDDFYEFTRIKHFIERIRDRQILKDKIISVKTKKPKVAAKSIQEGVDIINDSSGGTVDPALIEIISKSKVSYILSSYAGQENFFKLSMNNSLQLKPFDYYLQTVERRLLYCLEKGIPNWKIAIDLNLDLFGKKLSIDIYDGLKLFKNKFDNTLISSFNIQPVLKSIVPESKNQNEVNQARFQIIEYLVASGGINMVRYDNLDNLEIFAEHASKLGNIGEKLHTGFKERRKLVEYEEQKIKEVEKVKLEEVQYEGLKEDELTIFMKKLEAGKI